MNKGMKKFLSVFSPKEIIVVTVSVVLSGLMISSLFWSQEPSSSEPNPGEYVFIGYDLSIVTSDGTSMGPFDSVYTVYYEKDRPVAEKAQVQEILEENVPGLHKAFDRHHDYYLDDTDHSLGLMTNLKTLNESFGSGETLEIGKDLYDILMLGKEMTISTDGAFNMFIGELSDFWDHLISEENVDDYRADYQTLDPDWNAGQKAILERLKDVLPMTSADVNQVLTLTTDDDHYYARFNAFKDAQPGEISITLGGIAKGYANDLISAKLAEKGLTHGAIYGGGSSLMTLGDFYEPTGWDIAVESPTFQADYAFDVVRQGTFNMSTSGGYLGVWIPSDSNGDGVPDGFVLRHHIIDPRTGYPSSYHMEVNISSGNISNARMDALSTALICLSEADGMELRQTFLNAGKELNIAWINPVDLDLLSSEVTGYVLVRYTEGYETYMVQRTLPHYEKVSA